jgi:hypothetical protein
MFNALIVPASARPVLRPTCLNQGNREKDRSDPITRLHLDFLREPCALRHGPMAALDQESLLIAFLSSAEPRRNYELDLLREVGAKDLVRARIGVAGCGSDLLSAKDVDQLVAPQGRWDIPDLYRPVLDILFGQLLGLFNSLELGCKPDSPSPGGVISRVVHNVEIYPEGGSRSDILVRAAIEGVSNS